MKTVTVEVPEAHGKNRERRSMQSTQKVMGGVNLSLRVRHSSPVT
jgi:hypothetical protein